MKISAYLKMTDGAGNAHIVANGELTTEHAASSYGLPVFVVRGEAYGPADIYMLGDSDGVLRIEALESAIIDKGIDAAQRAGYKAQDFRA